MRTKNNTVLALSFLVTRPPDTTAHATFTGADPGFGQGGPELLRPKVADVAKRSRASEASILWLGSRARLKALEAFGFLMLKYAFSHILETLFLLFLTSILHQKLIKIEH